VGAAFGCAIEEQEVGRMNVCLKASKFLVLAAFLALATPLNAANSVPPGTILPVRLDSTISSAKNHPGQIVAARVMQDVPLVDGSTIHAGSKIVGHIVAVTPRSSATAASVTVRFDMLQWKQQKTPIVTNLRAVASFMAVDQAQVPMEGPDRGTPASAWTTEQIGGDTVYRGGGPVEGIAGGTVGVPVENGVLSRLNANPDGGCRAAVDANDTPQALWVFSSNACGAYGLANLQVGHFGRTHPAGDIVFGSTKGDVNVQHGSGMLLRVDGVGDSGA
jgi:hypothetical protein